MQKIMLFIVGILFCLMSIVHAATRIECMPARVKVQGNNMLLLGPQKPAVAELYFIQNVGTQGVWMDHPTTRTSMRAGWSSYIRAGHWSALVLNRKDFMMSCALIKPGNVDYKPCVRMVHVCIPKNSKFKNPPKETYWIVEDKGWDEAITVVGKRGVEFAK